jgi:hypothetical protein
MCGVCERMHVIVACGSGMDGLMCVCVCGGGGVGGESSSGNCGPLVVVGECCDCGV